MKSSLLNKSAARLLGKTQGVEDYLSFFRDGGSTFSTIGEFKDVDWTPTIQTIQGYLSKVSSDTQILIFSGDRQDTEFWALFPGDLHKWLTKREEELGEEDIEGNDIESTLVNGGYIGGDDWHLWLGTAQELDVYLTRLIESK